MIIRQFYNQFVKHLTNYFGVDTPYRDADFQQAQDRIYRIGQDTEVFIYILTIDTGNEPNIITHNKEIMEWSGQITSTLIRR